MEKRKIDSLFSRGIRDFPTLCDKLGRVDDIFEFNRLVKEGYTLQEIARYLGVALTPPVDTLMEKQYKRIKEGRT